MKNNWNAYWRLMRFDRPIGALLLLWPTWWGLLMAGNGFPSVRNTLIFTLGVIVMRAAGCVMNDIADRNYDPHVERTRNRPLASGELTLRQAVITFLILMLLALGLVLQTDRQTVLLAIAGALLAASYPFFKRFTHFPQVVLGVAFGWGIPMAFSAETGSVPGIAWALFGVNIIWVVIYDTLYAMVDRDDDLAVGVKSTAILFAGLDLLILKILMLLMLLMLLLIGWQYALTWPWFAAVGLVSSLFAWQQWISSKRDRKGCFRAFLNNNWVGFSIFIGLLGHFIWG
jgi:4-hydroxybenzoate polyprenyltransferase